LAFFPCFSCKQGKRRSIFFFLSPFLLENAREWGDSAAIARSCRGFSFFFPIVSGASTNSDSKGCRLRFLPFPPPFFPPFSPFAAISAKRIGKLSPFCLCPSCFTRVLLRLMKKRAAYFLFPLPPPFFPNARKK